MGTARSFIATAALCGITSCGFDAQPASPTQTATPAPPTERPATYGVPRSLGGSTFQWSLMITVDALDPDHLSWFSQSCTDDVEELSRRQRLFADRLDVALAGILMRNAHCAIATLAPLAYGTKGCRESDTSQPSGVYAVFSCTNSEPLNTTPPPTSHP